MTDKQREQRSKLLATVINTITETVKEAGPNGAPSGVMYAALMSIMDLSTYELIMKSLCDRGLIIKRGHVYYAVK